MDSYGDSSSSIDISRQQKAILAQLFRVVQTVEQVDQLFQWLAASIVQGFRIQLIQFWTVEATGLLALPLSPPVRQDATLPEQIVANNDLALLAQRMARERRIYGTQPVESLFSQYRASLLKRYRLNYCTGSFMTAHALLPPPAGQAGTPGPFAMTILIFVSNQPQPNLMPSITSIVSQAVILARNRGVLLPIASGPTPTRPLRQEPLPLSELIPRRREDTDTMLLNNPFSTTAVIADKQARRLYMAIHGRTNVAELCRNTGMNLKEVYTALCILLDQKRIDLYEPDGQLVDVDLLPDNF